MCSLLPVLWLVKKQNSSNNKPLSYAQNYTAFNDNQCTILSFTKCYSHKFVVNKMVLNRWELVYAKTGGQNYRNTLVTKLPQNVQQLGELCVLNHCLDINKQAGLLPLEQWTLIAMGQGLKDEGAKTSQGDSGCYKTNPFSCPGRWRRLFYSKWFKI